MTRQISRHRQIECKYRYPVTTPIFDDRFLKSIRILSKRCLFFIPMSGLIYYSQTKLTNSIDFVRTARSTNLFVLKLRIPLNFLSKTEKLMASQRIQTWISNLWILSILVIMYRNISASLFLTTPSNKENLSKSSDN